MLKGDLADFTLPDILRLLSITHKSGRLQLRTPEARGRVDLIDGCVRDASADADRVPLARRLIGRSLVDADTLRPLFGQRASLPTDLELANSLLSADVVDEPTITDLLREQTVDAVFDLLRWPSGTFEFEGVAAEPPRSPALALLVEELLSESEQRLERWSKIHERTGPGDAVVTVGRPGNTSVQVDADGWQLLGLADGQRTIDDLASLSGRGQYDTRVALLGLLELGVVTIGEQGGKGSIDRLLADHRALAELEGGAPASSSSAGSDQSVPPRAGSSEPSDAHAEAPPATPREVTPSEPPPVTDDQAAAEDAPGQPAPTATDEGSERTVAEVTPLRARNARLRTDPTVDAELVSRLIDGVEGM